MSGSTLRIWLVPAIIWNSLFFTSVFPSLRAEQVQLPNPDPHERIVIYSDSAHRWTEGVYEVWFLRGQFRIEQGNVRAHGNEAILWIERSARPEEQPHKVITYAEGDIHVDYFYGESSPESPRPKAATLEDDHWWGRFYAKGTIQLHVPSPAPLPRVKPKIYERAFRRSNSMVPNIVQPAQFEQVPLGTAIPLPSLPNLREIEIHPRYNVRPRIDTHIDPNTNERVIIYEQGIMLIARGLNLPSNNKGSLSVQDTIEVLADRVVVWTSADAAVPLVPGQRSAQKGPIPFEIYMEGNIEFREGDRIIRANRMYYNLNARNGTILDAEAETPAPLLGGGRIRLKAEVLQQLDTNQFQAYGASITTSRLGVPQYWLQSDNIYFRHEPRTSVDPQTGTVVNDDRYLATSQNNLLYFFGVPIFYWPSIATDLSRPSFYLKGIEAGNDSVFGTEMRTDWDLYQLLSIDQPPAGTEWDLSVDYLSQRGLGYGTTFEYDREGPMTDFAATRGFVDAWFINDDGVDNLGLGRRSLAPEDEFRGHVRVQHRQFLPGGFHLSGEIGWISDRNFLEQYYEEEWDQEKDQTTGLELKRLTENRSLNFSADAQINDFFTKTEGPRVDHFLLGGSFFANRLTWYQHTHVGYPRLETARLSTDPLDPASSLPWETTTGGTRYDNREGIRAATRHEIDLPFVWGPVKILPFVAGEVAYWGEDRFGEEVTRLFGQAGVRTSLPMVKINPNACNHLFNVNGLAHKVFFDVEWMVADANEDMARLPLYDPLQDDSVEAFQRRFIFNNYAGVLPTIYDDRSFALRSGISQWVSAPTTEVADDLMSVRSGVRQRWQTKRGLPGQESIIDWITLDVHGTVFPRANRDNFGEVLGLFDYDFRWHVGDRVTLLSDGFADFFGNGLRKVTIGGFLKRPGRGSVYLGLRSIDGPFNSTVLASSVNYRMSSKWITTIGSAVDLGTTGNIGQQIQMTRIGESLLVGMGIHVDVSRANVGAHLTIEPRILSRSRYSRAGGLSIPPVGTMGLE